MTTSYMHTYMEWSFCVLMEFYDDSTHVYSPTRLITQRSTVLSLAECVCADFIVTILGFFLHPYAILVHAHALVALY